MSTIPKTLHEEHHITPPSVLIGNLMKLSIFMGLTIAAYYFDFGDWIGHTLHLPSAMGSYINNFVAMAIALVKAYFVVSIFMGVKWGTKLIKLWALAGFVWVPLLLLILGDYMSRSWEPVKGWNTPSQVHGRDQSETALPSELFQTKAPAEEHGSTEHKTE